MKILITGADGFVGRHLIASSSGHNSGGHELVAVTRSLPVKSPRAACVAIGDMSSFQDWDTLLEGIDVVVHLAAKVHQADDSDIDAFDRDNRQLVKRMANAAIVKGVKRFIFLSTIKAEKYINGHVLSNGCYEFQGTLLPSDAYAESKAAAEQDLFTSAEYSPMEVVVIRPPLVYGPGVKANFLRLVHLAEKPYPLPFASINNRRDMISVFNLCDFIRLCIDHPRAKNHVFGVSDGRPYSLSELITAIRKVKGRRPGLFSLPAPIMRAALSLIGKTEISNRLLEDLTLDTSDANQLLNWLPAHTLEQTLQIMNESVQHDS